jgi:Helix-turn-helix domain of resolvase
MMSPTPATMQRIDNNGQPEAELPRGMKADGYTGKDIARYLGVSRATLYGYFAESAG